MFRGDSHLESDQIRKQQETPDRPEADRRLREVRDTAGGATERTYLDKQGRPMQLRTEGAEPARIQQAEAQDTAAIRHPIRLRSYDGQGQESGRANLTLETDKAYSPATGHYDRIADRRLRVNDIETAPGYRGSGIGGEHIEEAERIARRSSAREIYGNLSYEAQDEAAVRGFYHKHEYGTRPGSWGGQEVYKDLQSDRDAASLRRQLGTR